MFKQGAIANGPVGTQILPDGVAFSNPLGGWSAIRRMAGEREARCILRVPRHSTK